LLQPPYGLTLTLSLGMGITLLAGSAARAQVYCSQRAVVIDAPSNIRTAPNSRAPIACQLVHNGTEILVFPVHPSRMSRAGRPLEPDWYATMACYTTIQSRAIGLGRPPHYIHRSQVRLQGPNPDDWTAPAAQGAPNPQASSGCERLWQPSPQP
jgi:hypothetical protein